MKRISLSGASDVRQLKDQLEQELTHAAKSRDLRKCPGVLNKAHELASAVMAAKLVTVDEYASIKADLDRFC